jgi:uncharacterized membrane protein YdjX (TVP38/TMEM64 family)
MSLVSADEPPDPSPPPPGRALLALRIASLLPLVAGGLAYALSPALRATLDEGVRLLLATDQDGLRAWALALGPWAPLATTLLMVIQALAAPIPAVLVTATNALLWGVLWGGLLSISSATLAAVVCYLVARAWGQPVVVRLVAPERLESLQGLVDQHGWAAVLVSRLLPFVPFDPIGYAAGLAGMRLWTFTWATFLGQIPAGFFYSWLAVTAFSGEDAPSSARLAFFVVTVLIVLCLIGLATRRVLLREARPTDYHGSN